MSDGGSGGGIGLFGAAFLILFALKVSGVAQFSWLWLCLPPLAWITIVILAFWIVESK